ncbi:MAG TPA: glycosyl hydrolase family 65 protein [Solirubrobacterales bacterium]|nr:glycosyl hydrolase family 65 protein [Solirubrobacterales bacterium]
MISHPAYTVEPWGVCETDLDLDRLAQAESVFSLSNGHIGIRGTLDEGEPYALPGTYLNALWEARPLPYAEAGYGYPEAGETVVNMTNGKVIRLLVDDSPFDIRYGRLLEHSRRLDFRSGILRREALWSSPTGKTVRVTSERLVSFSQRAIMAVRYTVEPTVAPTRVVLQSELIANEPRPAASQDPRAAAAMEAPLESEEHMADDARAVLVHVTRQSRLRAATAMSHLVDGPDDCSEPLAESWPDLGRLTVTATPAPGEPLTITKFVAYGWSGRRSVPALRDQVSAALAEVTHTGWDRLVAEQREYLDDFWDRADVELGGDAELQQAVRFGLFHALQASARGEGRAIPAKGLTGPGYDGHTFWDTEAYVLPLLSYAVPEAAAEALRWRLETLEKARERAEVLCLEGAAFPWRTISGAECGAYWPAGTAAFHINGDIAFAVCRYCDINADPDFEREVGLPLLVETARLWRSLGHHDAHGAFRIDGVTGPDEYSAIADNNVYTNLVAQKNLHAAADFAERHAEAAEELRVDHEEIASWRDAAKAMTIPYDEELEVHPQAENFTKHARWDFDRVGADNYPLLLHYPYFDLYRKQVVKQADLVMAMLIHSEAFTAEEKARNFAYYEPLTVRDSSLSACVQAVIAAETGHLELAYDYLGEAALMDLDDLEHNSSDGLHIASLAGSWIATVLGFGGLRDQDGVLRFAPRLPERLDRISFRLNFRGSRIKVDITDAGTAYSLLCGDPVRFRHFEEEVELGPDGLSFDSAPPAEPPPEPVSQPPGRAPQKRKPSR